MQIEPLLKPALGFPLIQKNSRMGRGFGSKKLSLEDASVPYHMQLDFKAKHGR